MQKIPLPLKLSQPMNYPKETQKNVGGLKRFFRKARWPVVILATLAMLYFLLKDFDMYLLAETFKYSRKFVLILSTAAMIVFSLIFPVLRLRQTLKILNHDIGFAEAFKINMAILPVSKLSPANSGDMARSFFLKGKVSFMANTGGIFFERAFDVLVLSMISLVGSIIIKNTPSLMISGGVMAVSLLFFYLMGKNRFFSGLATKSKRIENFQRVFSLFFDRPKMFLGVFLYTLAIWATALIYVKFLFYSFGQNITFLKIASLQPIVSFASMLPATISGIGLREWAMLKLYSGFSPEHVILSVGFAYSFLGAFVLPLLGTPFMYNLIRNKKAAKNEQT